VVLNNARRTLSHDAEPTFRDAALEFLRYTENVLQVENSTLRDYRSVIERALIPRFGAVALTEISADLIETYRDELLSAGRIGNRTIVRHLTVLHGVFRRAKRVWRLKENPASAELVRRPRVNYSGEFDLLRPPEITALCQAAESEADAALFMTAAYTGLRQGELLALRWRDLDLPLRRLHVRRNYTHGVEKAPKSKRVRSVPLADEVSGALGRLSRREKFTAHNDLVFCDDEGTYLDHHRLRRRFYAALQRAGVRRVRFHDLRHCFACLAVQALPLSDVQGYLGHAHIATTMRYVHHAPGARDAALLSSVIRGNSSS
jgi:integrase